MSSFDASKQTTHAEWETGKKEGDLIVGVYSYNNGEPKLGFARYYENKKTGEPGIKSAGRLTWEDLMYIESILEEIKSKMEGVK